MRIARVTFVLCLLATGAFADVNDIRISQLGNPNPGGPNYSPQANASFRISRAKMGAALNSVNLTPPSTTGHSGFAVNVELTVADLRPSGYFVMPTERPFSGPLLIPSVHIRKGLPFSFELGSRIAWIDRSKMFAATGELKWAINEGFLYLPDLSLRTSVTRLLNSRDFELTTAGFDVGLGKKFPIGGMVTLTPYAGWNLVWVSAFTQLVEFRPEATQAEAMATTTAQLANAGIYEEAPMSANSHNRFYVGLRFIGGVVQLTGEFSYSNLGKVQVPDAAAPATLVDYNLPPVIAWNFSFGLDF